MLLIKNMVLEIIATTVNKFGNYLFIKTQEQRLTAPQPVQGPSIKSVCVFNIREKLKVGSVYYFSEYCTKFKICSRIQHLEISTDSTTISINQANPVSAKSFIGTMIIRMMISS